MKKIFTTLCLAAFCGMSAQAQVDTLMRVTRANGRVHYIPITEIQNVDFVEVAPWVDPTPNKTTIEDYFDIKVTRCERVADVLIMEFSMTNLTNDEHEITFNTNGITAKDDLGNSYSYGVACALGNQGYATSDRTILIDGHATKYGKLRVNSFDTSNKATSMSVAAKVFFDGRKLDNETFTFRKSITDNRPVKRGVQTCDKNLRFDVVACERVGHVLILDFTLTNTGAEDIMNYTFGTNGITCKDDLGNSYSYDVKCAFGKQGYANEKSIVLDAGGTVKGRMRVSNMESTNKAEEITLFAKCSSTDYLLEDGLAKFMRIPITDKRVLARGIQSCDRNLNFKFVSFTRNGTTGVIDYTITNTSDVDIQDFSLAVNGITCTDDLGNSYSYDVKCSFGNQGYSNSRSVELPAGGTVTGHLQISNFKSGNTYVNLIPKVSSTDYILDDPNNVYFLQIPTGD